MNSVLRRCGYALSLAAGVVTGQAQAPARLTPQQTLGRYVSAGLVMVGPDISQDSLAAWWARPGSVSERSARLSAIRDGSVSASDSELVSLAVMLDSLWRNRADTSVEWRAGNLYQLARGQTRPRRAHVARVTGPAAPPQPAAPQLPIAAQRIATNRLARGTYRIDVPGHGLVTGQAIRVIGHQASPSLEGRRFWVQVVDGTILWLWADSARTRPVVVRTAGSGGTIEIQR